MKRLFSLILIAVMALALFSCGKAAEPISSSAPPASSVEPQPHYTGPEPSDMIIYPSLNAVTPNTDAKMLTADEVDLFGLNDEITQEDILRIFGEPKEILPFTLEQWKRKSYIYDDMRFTFIEALNGEPRGNPTLYVAEFTRDDLIYPRGIKLGDSLYDVVAKFPQERDYRSEAMYGVPMDKFTDGFAELLDYDTLTHEEGNYSLLLCCGWWPTVCVNFDDGLKAKSVYIYYNPNGLGYP